MQSGTAEFPPAAAGPDVQVAKSPAVTGAGAGADATLPHTQARSTYVGASPRTTVKKPAAYGPPRPARVGRQARLVGDHHGGHPPLEQCPPDGGGGGRRGDGGGSEGQGGGGQHHEALPGRSGPRGLALRAAAAGLGPAHVVDRLPRLRRLQAGGGDGIGEDDPTRRQPGAPPRVPGGEHHGPGGEGEVRPQGHDRGQHHHGHEDPRERHAGRPAYAGPGPDGVPGVVE